MNSVRAYLMMLGLVGLIPPGLVHAKKPANKVKGPMQLKKAKLGEIEILHQCGRVYLAGQPSEADFAAARAHGVKTIINLRMSDELPWNEEALVKRLEMKYHHIPFGHPETLTSEVFDKVRRILKSDLKSPVMVHCASANRVGAVWLAYRVLDDGIDFDKALAESKTVGLRAPEYAEKALGYIQREMDRPPAKKSD